jgi:hypothetical protein
MTATYKRAYYTMTFTGKGQYTVTKETKAGVKTKHSTNAFIFDWMSDDSDPKLHKQALQALSAMFSERRQ